MVLFHLLSVVAIFTLRLSRAAYTAWTSALTFSSLGAACAVQSTGIALVDFFLRDSAVSHAADGPFFASATHP